jgi:hypothetical protein
MGRVLGFVGIAHLTTIEHSSGKCDERATKEGKPHQQSQQHRPKSMLAQVVTSPQRQ